MIPTLIVEDDPLIAAANAGYVGRVDGFAVVASAATGAEALRLLATTDVELVLLDVHLPDASGLEVLRRMRATGHRADVIMVTRARDLAVVRTAVSLGATQYLVKPFTFSAVRTKLEGYRDYRARLDGGPLVAQDDVDGLLGTLRGTVDAAGLPKGVSRESLAAAVDALAGAWPACLTAVEVAEVLGASRGTARRYLEYLTETGLSVRHARYGGTGRPQVEYRWRGGGEDPRAGV